LDADWDVSVTTTTLVRDSTLDSVASQSGCGPHPSTLLVDPDPCPAATSGLVHVVDAAAAEDAEHWNRHDLLRDVGARDVTPEPETGAISREVTVEPELSTPSTGNDIIPHLRLR